MDLLDSSNVFHSPLKLSVQLHNEPEPPHSQTVYPGQYISGKKNNPENQDRRCET